MGKHIKRENVSLSLEMNPRVITENSETKDKKSHVRNKFSYLVLPDLNGNMRDVEGQISNFKSAFNKTTKVQQYSSA